MPKALPILQSEEGAGGEGEKMKNLTPIVAGLCAAMLIGNWAVQRRRRQRQEAAAEFSRELESELYRPVRGIMRNKATGRYDFIYGGARTDRKKGR